MISKFRYVNVVLSLIVSIVSVYFAGKFIELPSSGPQLEPPPTNQDIYVLGNSMFGAGFSLNLAREELPNKKIDFAYYNGHYTSMWHLAVTIGMDRVSAPGTVVWGFRPTYAIYPAFRQNKNTRQAPFSRQVSSLHRKILVRAGDPAYAEAQADTVLVVDKESILDYEPFEKLGQYLVDRVQSPFRVLNGDIELLPLMTNTIAAFIIKSGAEYLEIFNSLFDDSGLVKPNDLLIRYVSNGEVQLADAQVIDNGNRFVQGNTVSFDDSFIPEISKEISKIGSDQLVVIFRPVTTFEDPLPVDVKQYYDAAVAYFKTNNIAVLDLMLEPGLTLDMYAEGDHLNQRGRLFVTKLIVNKLQFD